MSFIIYLRHALSQAVFIFLLYPKLEDIWNFYNAFSKLPRPNSHWPIMFKQIDLLSFYLLTHSSKIPCAYLYFLCFNSVFPIFTCILKAGFLF